MSKPFQDADPRSTFVEINRGYTVIRADRFKPGLLLVLLNDYPVMRHFKAGEVHQKGYPPRPYPYFNAVYLDEDQGESKAETVVMIVSIDKLSPNGEIWLTVLHEEIFYQIRHNVGIKGILETPENGVEFGLRSGE